MDPETSTNGSLVKSFECPTCGKQFSRKSRLKAHSVTHSGERPFGCPVCGKHFVFKNTLKPHIATHSGERPFGCSQCPQAFTLNSYLKIHMRTHEPKSPLPHSCPTCPKAFHTSQRLARHVLSHKSFECSVCGEAFPRLSLLKAHSGTHDPAKVQPCPSLACSTCGQGFGSKGALNQHARIEGHGRSRSSEIGGPSVADTYACHLCCEQFPEPQRLDQHLAGHSEDPALQCDSCNCGFRTLILLTKHLRTYHTILGL